LEKLMATRTVLITGASSGVGEATARLFARNGWNVVASARAVERIGGWADQPNIARLAMDVTDEVAVRAAVANAARRFGGLDALVNNAGAGLAGAFESISEADLKAVFDVNLFGPARTIRAAIPYLRASKSGVIVNVTSITGRLSLPFMAPYDSTKFALEGLSESLGYELSTVGIRVKLVEPGGIKTAFSHKWVRNPLYNPALDGLIDKMAIGATKAKGPEGVAQAIFSAASDPSARLRYTANGSGPMILLNRLLPPSVWRGMVASSFLGTKAGAVRRAAAVSHTRAG
jgi:NAD(P)-dependent dehydrogenase (short-subunit alcohol dehydrogenase family)